MVFEALTALHQLTQHPWAASTHGLSPVDSLHQAGPQMHDSQKLDGYGSLCGPDANNCSGERIIPAVHFKPDHEVYKDYLQDKPITVKQVHIQHTHISKASKEAVQASSKTSYSNSTSSAFKPHEIKGTGMKDVHAKQAAMQQHRAEVKANAKQVAANKAAEIHFEQPHSSSAGYLHQVQHSAGAQIDINKYHSVHYSYQETHIDGSATGYPVRPPDASKHPEQVAIALLKKGLGGSLSAHQANPEMDIAAGPGHLAHLNDHWWAGHEHCPGPSCVLVPAPSTQTISPTYMSGF
mmetsp:Transcript_8079/g.12816  ORF Transcript_8079/g.12816 Transcript_8079/m.12816 type:complete len:294 (-) Transcript_8079:101-982(-)|eukprot:CAMPEP_0184295308 /NCGR_PEP_ID=MMETSP1049-20130417/6193_1 /TAXON_ID=77928 /ORGANISM="Proteomonas sulcata, Strain CCMP704" /LENGTH=293 /DNA_ID=CAMNT_0026603781 /DNA_START=65 /DNA_END=946 /DNA_ORIENTATION=-